MIVHFEVLVVVPISADPGLHEMRSLFGWRWVAVLLEDAGVEVHPANVNKVHLIVESTQ
ncbi:MAG: hypothetical protein ACO1QS_01790 [Verrucomicrobiota bacterium]